MAKGYIYIMTNPCLQDMVKIGYATDVEARRKQLSTTALPYEYEVYATYETQGQLEDKKLHKMIDKLNPDLRVSQNREFFVMTPDDAYGLLESIAMITGTQNKLKRLQNAKTQAAKQQNTKRPAIDFSKCNIPVGAELVFKDDANIKVTVVDERKVLYNGELTSLSAIAKSIKGCSVAGPAYFTYNGKSLSEILRETQWKNL